jgi:hypothetical protein
MKKILVLPLTAFCIALATTGAFAQNSRQRVEFSGEVDEEAIIFISRNRISLKTSTTEPVYGLKYKFGSEFPRKRVNCYFKSKNGRGKIELIQQPLESNKYTAAIRITDTDRARAKYDFVLVWD